MAKANIYIQTFTNNNVESNKDTIYTHAHDMIRTEGIRGYSMNELDDYDMLKYKGGRNQNLIGNGLFIVVILTCYLSYNAVISSYRDIFSRYILDVCNIVHLGKQCLLNTPKS